MNILDWYSKQPSVKNFRGLFNEFRLGTTTSDNINQQLDPTNLSRFIKPGIIREYITREHTGVRVFIQYCVNMSVSHDYTRNDCDCFPESNHEHSANCHIEQQILKVLEKCRINYGIFPYRESLYYAIFVKKI